MSSYPTRTPAGIRTGEGDARIAGFGRDRIAVDGSRPGTFGVAAVTEDQEDYPTLVPRPALEWGTPRPLSSSSAGPPARDSWPAEVPSEDVQALGSAALLSGGPYLLLTYTQGHGHNPTFLGLSKIY